MDTEMLSSAGKLPTPEHMSIQDSTMKRLFGMANNQCAIPDCKSPSSSATSMWEKYATFAPEEKAARGTSMYDASF
jgi:hypothetical protein